MLTYCFESAYVARTLARCKKNGLAVIDTEGHESYEWATPIYAQALERI